jgi:OFA family oxalate/formate antiporter-like MFS transporter
MSTPAKDTNTSRWQILIPCIVAMLAIANLQYAWTFFTTDITKALHARLDAVQWTLTFFIIAQTVLFPINAYLVDRFGPRLMVTLASLFVAAGWVGAGRANSLATLYVVYAIGGIGAGAVYSACVGVAMKWFPDRRGLCVGVVAGSYGFGTALTIRPVAYLIEHNGYRTAFVVFGILQGVFVLLSAQFLRMPRRAGYRRVGKQSRRRLQRKVQQSERDYTPAEMLRSGSFHLLYLMMTLVTASGLMLTAQLKPIGVTYGYDKYALFGGYTVLTLTSSLNQVLNGSARPFFGWVSDRIGRYDTMAIVFVMEAITITLLTVVVSHPFWFIAISGLMFFAWGDIYSLFPAAIADIFGNKHATTNYGIQYTAKGIGSILGGPAAAWLMSLTNSWIPVFWSAVACNVIAAGLAVFWLKPRVARVLREETEAPQAKSSGSKTAEQVVVAKASELNDH